MDYSRILYGEIPFVSGNNLNNHYANNGSTNIGRHSGSKNGTPEANSNGSNNSHCNTANDLANLKRLSSETVTNHAINTSTHANDSNGYTNNEQFQAPKQQLCDPRIINLNWLQSEKIGGGLINIGNTCFLNSVLQCLTYCPPLYNYLIKYQGGHSQSCRINQFCMLCEMEKHIKRIKFSNGSAIKPVSIVQRLKYINKSFQYGRQEDAHEFLRYVIDHMWKACLTNLDIKTNSSKLDPRIKETTAINHIFGGYHRSQVLCMSCNNRSNTFDYFMDFILDIRGAKSLEEALKKFTQPETLQDENAYRCGKCKRKVTARKRFSVFKAPNVATFQLKRFDSDRIFGGKVTKFISYPEELDLGPYMSDTSQSAIRYQLNAVLVHVGHSSNSGHYFCYTKNSNGLWYRMDDSDVTVVNKNNVLTQQAYVLFYTKKASDIKTTPSNGTERIKQQNSTLVKTSNFTGSSSGSNHNDTISPTSSILNLSNVPKILPSNGVCIMHQSPNSTLSTWTGQKSRLEEDEAIKRKSHEAVERDKFNDELDQGKRKKIKSHKIDRFFQRSKHNPFQFIKNQ